MNGVGQGLITSPGLFNIYMEEVMKTLKQRCTYDIWYKLYADDLVLIVQHHNVSDVISNLGEVSKEFELMINSKKSGIFHVKDHDKIDETHIKERKIRDIPIVQ